MKLLVQRFVEALLAEDSGKDEGNNMGKLTALLKELLSKRTTPTERWITDDSSSTTCVMPLEKVSLLYSFKLGTDVKA